MFIFDNSIYFSDVGIYTQLWLVTDYHENGSLFDFLSKRVLTPNQLMNMASAIATGLAHLHMPIIGTQGILWILLECKYKDNFSLQIEFAK